MHFDLTLADGSAADSTRVNNKPALMQMGDGSLSPEFEACLLGLSEGQQHAFEIAGEAVFGKPNPDNVHHVDRSRFAAETELNEGMIMGFAQPDGSELPGVIRAVAGDSVTVDFNHPLAGQQLHFNLEVLKIS